MKSYTVTFHGLQQGDGSYHYRTQIHLADTRGLIVAYEKVFDSEDDLVATVNGILATDAIGGDVRNSLLAMRDGYREYFWSLTDAQAESLGWIKQE
jgi:hypothetical protein